MYLTILRVLTLQQFILLIHKKAIIMKTIQLIFLTFLFLLNANAQVTDEYCKFYKVEGCFIPKECQTITAPSPDPVP